MYKKYGNRKYITPVGFTKKIIANDNPVAKESKMFKLLLKINLDRNSKCKLMNDICETSIIKPNLCEDRNGLKQNIITPQKEISLLKINLPNS